MTSNPIIFNPGKPHFRLTFIVTETKTFIPGFMRIGRDRIPKIRYAIAFEHVNTCFVVTDKGAMPFLKYFKEISPQLDSASLFQIEVKDPSKALGAFFFALTSQIEPSSRMVQLAIRHIIRFAKNTEINPEIPIDEVLMDHANLIDQKTMLTWIMMAKDPRPNSEG